MAYNIDIIKRRREHIQAVLNRERFWITTGSIHKQWQNTVSIADGKILQDKYQNIMEVNRYMEAHRSDGEHYNSFYLDNEPTPELFNAIKDALVEELKRLEVIINERAEFELALQQSIERQEATKQYVSVFKYNTPVKSLWITDKFWIGLFIVIVIVSVLNFINSLK